MQILIIEDEARAANQLQTLLGSLDFEFELLEVIDSVEESISWLQNNESPELIFMDIQLADGLSFEIFQTVETDCPIIFTTAFDQYAIRAFKHNSIDYLLKPIQEADLSHALQKFNRSKKELTLTNKILQSFMSDLQRSKLRDGILVKDGDGFIQIRISELLYIYSEESITFGVTANKRVIIDETLDQLLPTLEPKEFFQINRGQIIAKSSIQKIDKYFNHRLKLVLPRAGEKEFIVSRQKTNAFKSWLNQ